MKTVDANLILGMPGTHTGGVETADELVAEMDRHEIERGLVTHIAGAVHDIRVGNELLFGQTRTARADRGRLIPVPVVDLNNPPGEREWHTWEGAGVRGVRVCPAFYGRGDSMAVDNLSTGTGIADLVAAGFEERLVWGSGYGISMVMPFRDVVRYSTIADEVQRAILRDNIISLLGAR